MDWDSIMRTTAKVKMVKKLLKMALFRLGLKIMSGSNNSISARNKGSGFFFSSV